jgi:hypothetical protein
MAMLNNQRVFITQGSISDGSQSIGWFEIPQIASLICIKIDRYSDLFKRLCLWFFQLYSDNVDTQHIK